MSSPTRTSSAARRPSDDELDRVFAALADRTRRAMLRRLQRGPARAGELAAPFDISKPAISRHLRVLEDAGLIARRIDGRVHHCELDPARLRELDKWLDSYRVFWTHSLDALAQLVEEPEDG